MQDKLSYTKKMLGYLLYNNPLKTLTCSSMEAPVSRLWQYGISGDLPILLLKIKRKRRNRNLRRNFKSLQLF